MAWLCCNYFSLAASGRISGNLFAACAPIVNRTKRKLTTGQLLKLNYPSKFNAPSPYYNASSRQLAHEKSPGIDPWA
jgi:hypothetical protein